MIAFDKNAPGGGVSAECRMENGKVILEWLTVLTQIDFRGVIYIRLLDQSGELVLEGMQASDEEEPLVSVLLQPHLWAGPENPYLYQLEAILEDRQGNEIDRVGRLFPLRCVELRRIPGEDAEKIFLNGACFAPKVIEYSGCILEDLERVLALGANCICRSEVSQLPVEVAEFCERNGLLTVVHTPGKLSVGGKLFSVDKDRSLEDYLGKIP